MKRWIVVFALLATPLFARDGAKDFDAHIGTWKTHVKRLVKPLVKPLTGSSTWVELNGTSIVRKVWDGRANLVELVAEGPNGAKFQGMSLRLYRPEAEQWSLHFASSHDGLLNIPTIGAFDSKGRGEFFSQETYNGRAIFVRFVITPVDADTIRFEQAFSDDGGKTWEVNWIATDRRIR